VITFSTAPCSWLDCDILAAVLCELYVMLRLTALVCALSVVDWPVHSDSYSWRTDSHFVKSVNSTVCKWCQIQTNSSAILAVRCSANTLCLRWHRFSIYFSTFSGVKIKITHSIVPINLHSSIKVTDMWRSPNVCPIVLSMSTYFRNITALANSAIESKKVDSWAKLNEWHGLVID